MVGRHYAKVIFYPKKGSKVTRCARLVQSRSSGSASSTCRRYACSATRRASTTRASCPLHMHIFCYCFFKQHARYRDGSVNLIMLYRIFAHLHKSQIRIVMIKINVLTPKEPLMQGWMCLSSKIKGNFCILKF